MRANLILPIIVLLFAIFFLPSSLQLPGSADGIGAGGWPTLILILMILLAIILFIQALITHKKEKVEETMEATQPEQEDHTVIGFIQKYRHWVVLMITFFYFFSIEYIGVALATPLFFIGMTKFLGMRDWFYPVMLAILFTVFIVVLFTVLLSVPLPRGIGIFREFNIMFY